MSKCSRNWKLLKVLHIRKLYKCTISKLLRVKHRALSDANTDFLDTVTRYDHQAKSRVLSTQWKHGTSFIIPTDCTMAVCEVSSFISGHLRLSSQHGGHQSLTSHRRSDWASVPQVINVLLDKHPAATEHQQKSLRSSQQGQVRGISGCTCDPRLRHQPDVPRRAVVPCSE